MSMDPLYTDALRELGQTRERAEEAERARDVARRDYEVMYRLCRGAEDERDALAAHAERLEDRVRGLESELAMEKEKREWVRV